MNKYLIKKLHIEKTSPIGIFDSGVGGLTIVNAIKKLMPNERIIYYGDIKNMPYGEKSQLFIRKKSIEIVRFLLKKKCKIIIIACNTISSNALNIIKNEIPIGVKLFDVITPIVINKFLYKKCKKLGIISTKATLKLGTYINLIKKYNPEISVFHISTPLLAQMIENGFNKYNNLLRLILNYYLKNSLLKNVDFLILACTHYFLIKKEIKNFYNNKINIINTPKILSKNIKNYLLNMEIKSEYIIEYDVFYVSLLTNNFKNQLNSIFKKHKKLIKKIEL